MRTTLWTFVLIGLVATGSCLALEPEGGSNRGEPDLFTAKVRPILSRYCFKCHGPDDKARKAYTDAFDEYAALLRRLALRNGGRYAGLPTSLAVEEAMFGPMVTTGGLA